LDQGTDKIQLKANIDRALTDINNILREMREANAIDRI